MGRSISGTHTKLHLQDPEDGVGEVATSGRNVFMGYLGEPDKTRETFDRAFWLLTGDMATIEDGFVTIRGRIKVGELSNSRTDVPDPGCDHHQRRKEHSSISHRRQDQV